LQANCSSTPSTGTNSALLRRFREQLMATEDKGEVTQLLHRLNLLSSYLKKRCVLFLKGQEDGRVRTDELAMAVSEICTYLRPLGLRVGVEWTQPESLRAQAAHAPALVFSPKPHKSHPTKKSNKHSNQP